MSALADLVRERRGAQTYREVAARASDDLNHLTPMTVWGIEAGRMTNPTAKTLVRLARALNVPAAELAVAAVSGIESS